MELMMNNEDEVKFLFECIDGKDVLEWGSGGSTLAILKLCKTLVSIEHDETWYNKVIAELSNEKSCIKVSPSITTYGGEKLCYYLIQRNAEEAPGHDGTFDQYLDYIKLPDYLERRFDVIFIDGRARVECAKIAVNILKPGGIILIHDMFNPDERYRRYEYEVVLEFLDHVGGSYALHAFKPKNFNLSVSINNSTMIAKEKANEMCWYDWKSVEATNRFYEENIKGRDLSNDGHIKFYIKLLNFIDVNSNRQLLDLGTGSAMISEYSKGFTFTGSDLPHMIGGSAMKWHPEHLYKACDIYTDDLNWISGYDIIVCNGFIDIMASPVEVLKKILQYAPKYVIIHRQEITEKGKTTEHIGPGHGGDSWHSIINRDDFNFLIDQMNFEIIAEEKLEFANWENGGCSFLIKKRQTWALDKIDHYLNEKYFAGKRNGTYLEAGANDGITQSNTYYFQKYKNWVGILIEPIGIVWERLCNTRPVNKCIHAALVGPEYNNKEIEMVYTPECYGLLSVVNDENAESLLKRVKNEKKEKMMVPAATLDSVLNTWWNTEMEIDLMVLDTEGYELNILRGIDFSKWVINYLLVEQLDCDNSELTSLLSKHFIFLELIGEHNYLYKRR